jgi:hypothetical protein
MPLFSCLISPRKVSPFEKPAPLKLRICVVAPPSTRAPVPVDVVFSCTRSRI